MAPPPHQPRASIARVPRAARPRIVALVLDAGDCERLDRALESLAPVVYCSRVEELRQAVREGPTLAVLVEPHDILGASTVPAVRALKHELPTLPVVGYCDFSVEQRREIVDLVRAGADELIFRGRDDDGWPLLAAIIGAQRQCAAARALSELRPLVGAPLADLIAHCLERAVGPLSLEEAAWALGVPRTTLIRHAVAAALPPPHELLAWCRLLVAATLLDDPGRGVEQTALALHFGSGSTLRRMFRRYTGMRVSEVRALGGSVFVLARFREALGERTRQPASA